MLSKTYSKTICPLDCPDSCGMVATVVDGRVAGLLGDRQHPYTNGFICRKMRRYPDRLYSSKRVLYPQLRVGKKGAGEFRRISWDEAMDHLAGRLADISREFGGESILPYSYAGNMGVVNRSAGYPLFHRLGTSQLDQTICSATAGAGWKKQCGKIPGCPPENAANADLIVAWGINIKVSNVHFWQYVSAARKKGARLLAIDPYRNQTARSADSYLQVKPAGDSALALGLIKSLIENDLVNWDFISRKTKGFNSLAQYIKGCDWHEFVEQSGVEREAIEALARRLSGEPRTFFRIGIGLTRNSRGGMAVRAINSLAAVLGLFEGGPGRGVLLTSGAFTGDNERLTYSSLSQGPTRKINMVQLGHALTRLDPPVKALFVYNANPVSVSPDSTMVRQGLRREDIFTVVHEQVMSPTAKYADLLLPATTFLENLDLYSSYGHFYLGVAKPVIEPVGEAKSNFDLFQELAVKMGFDEAVFYQSCEDRIIDYLSSVQGVPEGLSPVDIVGGDLVHSTNSRDAGRVMTTPDSRFLFASEDFGSEPSFPCLLPAGEFDDPDLQSRFPLKLITPPHHDLLNSTFGERYMDEPGELLVNPEDAAANKLADGQTVVIENHRGKCTRITRVTTNTPKGLVVAEGLFWSLSDSGEEGCAINDLTSQKLTDLGGGATFHESLVSIRATTG
ncbi:MAG: molybdopterin-containing oxidoreductase family protein [Desulforhopalus sp.]